MGKEKSHMSGGRSRPIAQTKDQKDGLIDLLWQQEVGNIIKFGEKTGDAKVQEFINEALKKAQGKTQPEKLENAWIYLKDRRDTYNERIDELVAAEQYLFARAKVAGHQIWFPYLNVAVPAYQTYKWFFYSLGLESLLWRGSLEGHIPSPPSDLQLQWGRRGVQDGMRDHQAKLQQIIENEFKKASHQSQAATHVRPQKPQIQPQPVPDILKNQENIENKSKPARSKSRVIDPFSGKPRRSVLEVKPHTPLDPKYHWVFPPEVITRSRPESNFLKSLWLQGINKPKPSQPLPPKMSFIDPIKLAAQKLQTTPGATKPIFESTIDALKRMERQVVDQQKTQQWLRNVSQQLNKGFQARPFQAQPMVRGGSINPLRDMWERGINKSRPSPFGFPKTGFIDPIKQAAQNLRTSPGPAKPIFESTIDTLKRMERQAVDQQKTQQWLRNVSRDLNRGFPSKPIQPKPMLGQGAPSSSSLRNIWEMGVRSRPALNPLRMMSQGLK